jgi:hypothetical protein
MGIKTLPPMERRLVACNAKSYRIRNLRNLAMGVARHSGTPRPSAPAPVPGRPCPLARSPMDSSGDHGVGAYARAREESATRASPLSSPKSATLDVRTPTGPRGLPEPRARLARAPEGGEWRSDGHTYAESGRWRPWFQPVQEGANIVNVNAYNPRRKAPRIAERMRPDGSPLLLRVIGLLGSS